LAVGKGASIDGTCGGTEAQKKREARESTATDHFFG